MNPMLLAQLNELPCSSKKRTEENNKFAFKYALKILKRDFRRARPDFTAGNIESAFFEHYFGAYTHAKSVQTLLDPKQARQNYSTFSNTNL